ncbi:MAG: helix-turn-helix transcriptional regulator [Gammaproteobacteria bacterium]
MDLEFFNKLDKLDMVKHSTSHEDLESLGGRLRRRRKELGWTQMFLAEQVGTSQAVIQKIENGKSLRPRILEQIADSLAVKPAWLMFGVEEVGELNEEAIELARAWARLSEPHRSAMKDAILKIGTG